MIFVLYWTGRHAYANGTCNLLRAYNKLQLDLASLLACWSTALAPLAQNCPLPAREKTSDRPRFSCRSYGELTYQRFVASKRFSIDQYIAVSIGGQASLKLHTIKHCTFSRAT